MTGRRQLHLLKLVFALAAESAAAAAPARPPLYDPVLVNIGLNCRWEMRCMKLQQRSMNHALNFIHAARAPTSRIHRCNRNASRGRSRIDWVGFDRCVRNRRMD